MARKVHLLAVLAVLVLVVAGCDWQMDHFGPGRTSDNPADTTIAPANVASLAEQWTANLGGNGTDPVVAGGRVLVTTTAGYTSNLDAFDASGTTNCTPSPTSADPTTCMPEWSVPFTVTPGLGLQHGDLLSGPAVSDDNGLVYIGLDAPSVCNGGLIAPNDISVGETLAYHADTGSPASGFGGEGGASPAVMSGQLYTVVDNCFHESGVFAASSRLAVLNSATGALAFEAGDPSYNIGTAPAVAGNSMYAALDNTLEAFDATGNTNCGPPPPDQLFSTATYCLPIWTADAGGAIKGTPVVSHGTVFVVAADPSGTSGTLAAFPAAGCGATTCTPLWTAPIAGAPTSAPAVTPNQVVVGSSNGTVSAFNANGCGAATCTALWSGTVGGAINVTPSLAGTLAFVASADGTLSAFSIGGCGQPTCTSLWSTNVGAAITTQPAVANGQVFVVDSAGTLHAYGLPPS